MLFIECNKYALHWDIAICIDWNIIEMCIAVYEKVFEEMFVSNKEKVTLVHELVIWCMYEIWNKTKLD